MKIELALQESANEININLETLRELGDVELSLVGGGDVVVVGL